MTSRLSKPSLRNPPANHPIIDTDLPPNSARLTTTRRTASLVLVAVLAIPLIVVNALSIVSTMTVVLERRDHGGDYIAFYSAGLLYLAHHDGTPYDLQLLRETELVANPALRTRPDWVANRLNPFRNPPFYLPVVGFLAQFSLPTGFAISTAVEGVLLAALLAIAAWAFGARASPLKVVTWVLVSLAYSHAWQGLEYGQIPSYAVALAFAAGILLLRSGRSVWAGLAFALLWLKLQYLAPLVLFLLLSKERKALLGLMGGSALLLLLSLVNVGLDGMRHYFETLWQLAIAPPDLYFANFQNMYNWRGLLERIFAPAHPEVIFPTQIILVVFSYALAVWAWLAPTRGIAWRQDARVMLLGLTMLLVSPHTHGQDLILLLLPLALVTAHLWSDSRPWPVTLASGLGLLVLFGLLPHFALLIPGLHLGALLVVLLFLTCVLALRTDILSTPFKTIRRGGS